MSRPIEEQTNDKDESLTIPKDCFVYNVDLDAKEPYCIVMNESNSKEERIPIPRSLAYFLTTHFCGSNKMQKAIEEHAKIRIKNKILSILGISKSD